MRSRKRFRLSAGFKDDFEILEVVIEEIADGTGSEEIEDVETVLDDEVLARQKQEENRLTTYRMSTGFVLGLVGVGLGLLSLIA